ncbi:MAG: ParB/RepB/Spo0J family partition protein [Gammaproteobacteria bacterium]|nr:ParB/RepB/Spo0J family partition protein [Gammaproteobacteria bacterium]
MTQKNMALGKGLAALLGDLKVDMPLANQETPHHFSYLPIGQLVLSPFQARTHFDESKLDELAQSIQAQGLLQPICVRPKGDVYEIIAGERRWRACQKLAKVDVPVIIHQVDDKAAMALGLVENLQREDLNPIEQANGMARLLQEFSLTHQELANLLGTSRTQITNHLRLLQLEPELQQMLIADQISMGHARCLVGIETNLQIEFAEKTYHGQWSVRTLEKMIQEQKKSIVNRPQFTITAQHQDLTHLAASRFATKMEIKCLSADKGKMIIHFSNQDQLEHLLRHLTTEA